MIRILLADDDPIIVQGLSMIIGSKDGFEVIKDAVQLRSENNMDLHILVISGTDDKSVIDHCYKLGIDAYIAKIQALRNSFREDGFVASWHLETIESIAQHFSNLGLGLIAHDFDNINVLLRKRSFSAGRALTYRSMTQNPLVHLRAFRFVRLLSHILRP